MQADYLHIRNCSSFMMRLDTWPLVGSTLRRNTALPDALPSYNKYRGKLITFISEIVLHSQYMDTNWNMLRRNIDLTDP